MITQGRKRIRRRTRLCPGAYPPIRHCHFKTEPFLFDDYIVHAKRDHFIFVGYPLKNPFNEKQMGKALEDAMKTLQTGIGGLDRTRDSF